MATDVFLIRDLSEILEIQTIDDAKLYVTKGWLMNLSPYFNALLTNGFKESSTCNIKLNYKSKIILVLFQFIYEHHMGENYIRANIMNNINELEDIYSLWSAINEYQLDSIKDFVDIYFSSKSEFVENKLLNVESLRMVLMHGMEHIRERINEHFAMHKDNIDILDMETLPCDILNFFTISPPDFSSVFCSVFCSVFEKWAKIHNPTDEELDIANIDYDQFKTLSRNSSSLEKLVRTVRRLTKAPKFQAIVYGKISYILVADKTKSAKKQPAKRQPAKRQPAKKARRKEDAQISDDEREAETEDDETY